MRTKRSRVAALPTTIRRPRRRPRGAASLPPRSASPCWCRRRRGPSTVRVTWGDYVTEPPLSTMQLTEEGAAEPEVEWLRQPRDEIVELPVPDAGKGRPVVVPDSAASGLPGGALELVAHARPFTIALPGEAPREVRALSVFLVNRRKAARRRYADVAYAFQARLEIRCDAGLVPRCDLSAYGSDDEDQRIADLHYRDEVEYAVGRNSSAGWETPDELGVVRRAWTDPLPMAEVERVAPNEDIRDVEFGMEALAELAAGNGEALVSALEELPVQYAAWIEGQRALLEGLPERRRETGARLIAGMAAAEQRIAAGLQRLATDERTRLAFRIANLAVARALRRRAAGSSGDPAAIDPPGLAAVPAGIHPAQSRRPGGEDALRSRAGRSPVLPDRWRQDRGVPRARRVHDCPSAARCGRCAGRRRRRDHALHPSALDPRSAVARRRHDLCAGADAHGSGVRR